MSPDKTQLNAVHSPFWLKCEVHMHKTNNNGMHERNNRDIYETNEIASGFLLQSNMSNPPFIVPKTPQFTKVHNCFCIVSSCFKSSLHCTKGDRSKTEWSTNEPCDFFLTNQIKSSNSLWVTIQWNIIFDVTSNKTTHCIFSISI